MTDQSSLEADCWELRWAAEISSRYHRRHAAWLDNADFVLNVIQVLSATAAFIELTRGAPSWIASVGTLTIVTCALIQILGRLSKTSLDHELLMRDWCDLLTEIETDEPTISRVNVWKRKRGELNKHHVGELRGLAVAAENEAATALGVLGRQRQIRWWQWLFLHVATLQRTFPVGPDIYLPTPRLQRNDDAAQPGQ